MAEIPFVPADDADDEETESPAEKGDAGAEDAALIAAAEAAMKAEEGTEGAEKPKVKAKDDELERDEKGRFKPPVAPAKKAPPQDEKPSSVIARELAKREERRAEESTYKSKMAEADQVLARARQVSETLASERAALQKEREEISQLKATIRRDPMAAMKEVGWTAEQFISNAERARDPGYQEVLAVREELAKRDAVIEELRSGLKELRTAKEQYDTQSKEQQSQAEIREFWGNLPENSPVFEDYDDQSDILYFARKVRQQYFDATGKVASPSKVAEYLHYRALKRREGVPAETAGRKPKAGETKAKVQRALGSGDASERRGSPGKHIHDMSPEDERQYLMDVATQAVAVDEA